MSDALKDVLTLGLSAHIGHIDRIKEQHETARLSAHQKTYPDNNGVGLHTFRGHTAEGNPYLTQPKEKRFLQMVVEDDRYEYIGRLPEAKV